MSIHVCTMSVHSVALTIDNFTRMHQLAYIGKYLPHIGQVLGTAQLLSCSHQSLQRPELRPARHEGLRDDANEVGRVLLVHELEAELWRHAGARARAHAAVFDARVVLLVLRTAARRRRVHLVAVDAICPATNMYNSLLLFATARILLHAKLLQHHTN